MRLLVVHANAPPAAGSRSERWSHLAPELVRRGHEVVVLRCALPEGYPAKDPALEQRLIEGGVRVITLDGGWAPRWRYPTRPRTFASSLKRLRAELLWPDCWMPFALEACRFIDEHKSEFDVVVTPAQPWSGLFAGYEAARKHGHRWIADYGDPWGVQFRHGRWSATLDARIEREILPLASAIVVTTEATSRLFEKWLHVPHERLHVIPAGVEWKPSGRPDPSLPLTVIQAGTVYGPRISILPFLQAVRDYRSKHTSGLRLVWFGEVSRRRELRELREVADSYRVRGTSVEIAEAERSAHVHLILGNHGGVQVPGKLWRVLGTNRIPLVITEGAFDPLCETRELREVAVFSANRVEATLQALETTTGRSPGWDWDRVSPVPGLPSWNSRGVDFAVVLGAAAALSTPRPFSAKANSLGASGYGLMAFFRRVIGVLLPGHSSKSG